MTSGTATTAAATDALAERLFAATIGTLERASVDVGQHDFWRFYRLVP